MDFSFIKRSLPFLLIGVVVLVALVTGIVHMAGGFDALIGVDGVLTKQGLYEVGNKETALLTELDNAHFIDINPAKYNDNTVIFIADTSSWQRSLQLQVLAGHSKGSNGCPYSTPNIASYLNIVDDVCAWPYLLISYGDTFPLETTYKQYAAFVGVNKLPSTEKVKSIKLYVSREEDLTSIPSSIQKDKDNGHKKSQLETYLGNSDTNLFGGDVGIDSEQVFPINNNFDNPIKSYLDFWVGGSVAFYEVDLASGGFSPKNSGGVLVISQETGDDAEDYATGLAATKVAQLLRVPLLFEKTDMEIIKRLHYNSIIIVGKVSQNTENLLLSSTPIKSAENVIHKPNTILLRLNPSNEILFDDNLNVLKSLRSSGNSYIGTKDNGGRRIVILNSLDLHNCIENSAFNEEFTLGKLSDKNIVHETFCGDSILAPYYSTIQGAKMIDLKRNYEFTKKTSSIDSFNIIFINKARYFFQTSKLNDPQLKVIQEFDKKAIKDLKSLQLTELDTVAFLGAPNNMIGLNLVDVHGSLNPLIIQKELNTKFSSGFVFGLTPADSAALIVRSAFIDWISAPRKDSIELVSMDYKRTYIDNFASLNGRNEVFNNEFEVSHAVFNGLNQVTVDAGDSKPSEGKTFYVDAQFPYNKDVLYTESDVSLKTFVKNLEAAGVKGVSITSHTDCRGTTKYNEDLALRRANHIAQKFSEYSKITVSSIGMGEREHRTITADLKKVFTLGGVSLLDNPACANKILDGGCWNSSGCIDSLPTYDLRELAHRYNRRVEIKITSTEKEIKDPFSPGNSFVAMSLHHADPRNDDIHIYHGPDKGGVYTAYDTEFAKKELNMLYSPIHIFDVAHGLNFCFEGKCETSLTFPLGLRAVRSWGSKAFIGLLGDSSVPIALYVPDIFLQPGEGMLVGEFPGVYFDAYALHHPALGVIQNDYQNNPSVANITPNIENSVANYMVVYGDPFAIIKKPSSYPMEELQILHIDKPDAFFGVIANDVNSNALDTFVGESMFNYDLLTKNIPYSEFNKGSFDVYVLAENPPKKITYSVYGKDAFYQSYDVKLKTYLLLDVDERETQNRIYQESLSASKVISGTASCVEYNDNTIFKTLKVGDSKIYKCSLTDVFSNTRSAFDSDKSPVKFISSYFTWSDDLKKEIPFRDLVLFVNVTGNDGRVKSRTSHFRVFKEDVFMNTKPGVNNIVSHQVTINPSSSVDLQLSTALIHVDRVENVPILYDKVSKKRTLLFDVNFNNLNYYYYSNMPFPKHHADGAKYILIGQSGDLELSNISKLIVDVTISGNFLKQCQEIITKEVLITDEVRSSGLISNIDLVLNDYNFCSDTKNTVCLQLSYMPDLYADLASISFNVRIITNNDKEYVIDPVDANNQGVGNRCYCKRLLPEETQDVFKEEILECFYENKYYEEKYLDLASQFKSYDKSSLDYAEHELLMPAILFIQEDPKFFNYNLSIS